MKKIILLITIASSLLFAGPTLTPEVKQLLSKAKEKEDGVSAEDLRKMLKKDSIVLIDVRNQNEWAKGTIKSNKLVKITRGLLEIKYPKLILSKYSKDDHFVVYCALEPRSVFAASRLKELGFKHVRYLKGGYKHWNK